jgi:hypothetical protein
VSSSQEELPTNPAMGEQEARFHRSHTASRAEGALWNK